MGLTENLIRSCWDYYAYDDAIILSELYYAEKRSDHAAFLLATSYFRNSQYSSAYEFLKTFGVRTPETKFLFARCCEQLNKLTEAEQALIDADLQTSSTSASKATGALENELGTASPFAHAMLGRIYSKTNRASQAISEHRAALKKLPVLFESFKALRNLGADDDTKHHFTSGPFVTAALTASKTAEESMSPLFNPNAPLRMFQSGAFVCNSGNSRTSTPEIFVNSIDTPPMLHPIVAPAEHNANSSNCKTPHFNSNLTAPDPKLVPKAPTKNPARRCHLDSNHNGSRVVTRQQSQRVLTQNQSKIATRRSTRLFPSSVKENENEITSIRSDKINAAKISVAKKTARTRKADPDRLLSNNELNKAKAVLEPQGGVEKPAAAAPALQENKRLENATLIAEVDLLFDGLRKFADIEAALSQYDSRRAIELVQHLPDCYRLSPLGLLALAQAYFEQANYQKADECFREMRRRYSYFVKGMEYYSTTLWHLQRDTDLSALAQELTEQHRSAPESWCSAGNCFSLQKDNDTAIRFFQRAIQLNPDFAYAYTLLGHEYVAIEAYEQSVQCFRSALRLQPRHYNAWYGIGLIYYKQEKLGLARLHLRRAVEINPRNSVLMCHVSLVQQGLEDRAGAMKLLDEALVLSPRNALCRYHRAHLLFAQDRHEEALAELNELKQLAPKEPMVYFLAGKVHKKMGQPHLALMNFSWATELDPRGEQHQPVIGDRRYDEEPVTALAAMDPDEVGEIQAMDSDDSS